MGFPEGELREGVAEDAFQQVYGVLLALVVAHAYQEDVVVVPLEVVILDFARHEGVCSGPEGLGDEEGACPAAQGHGAYRPPFPAVVHQAVDAEGLLQPAEEVVGGEKNAVEFKEVRGEAGIREAEVMLNGEPLHLAVVHGLANARKIAEQVVNGTCKYDLIEVMACPMGCVGGAGQPVSVGAVKKKMRAQGLFASDRNNQMRKAQENPAVKECYEKYLGGGAASHKAHEVLHTHYVSRPQILDMETDLIRGGLNPVEVELNFAGQNMKNGAEKLMGEVLAKVRENKWTDKVKVKVTFGKAGENPIVSVAGKPVDPNVGSVVSAVGGLLK